MIECRILDVECVLQEKTLTWSFRTDLPIETIMMISCFRYYKDFEGRQFKWPIYEDRVFCQPTTGNYNGNNGEIDLELAESDSIQSIFDIHTEDWRGIMLSVYDAIHFRCHLVPYQRERLDDFGENNKELSGPEVYQNGDCFFVTQELSLSYTSKKYKRTTRRST